MWTHLLSSLGILCQWYIFIQSGWQCESCYIAGWTVLHWKRIPAWGPSSRAQALRDIHLSGHSYHKLTTGLALSGLPSLRTCLINKLIIGHQLLKTGQIFCDWLKLGCRSVLWSETCCCRMGNWSQIFISRAPTEPQLLMSLLPWLPRYLGTVIFLRFIIFLYGYVYICMSSHAPCACKNRYYRQL